MLVDVPDGRVVLHVLEGEDAGVADGPDEPLDERDRVHGAGRGDAGREVLGLAADDARLAVDHEEGAAVYAEQEPQLARRRAEDLGNV